MKHLTLSLALPVLMGLPACTTTKIESNSPSVALIGTLRTGLQEHWAELVYNGNTYRGVWRESAATAGQLAQVAYPHRKHLMQLSLDLSASDGNAISCTGLTHGMQGDLTCDVNGSVLKVTLN